VGSAPVCAGYACDDLRLAGLKLIFLIVTRAVSLLSCDILRRRWARRSRKRSPRDVPPDGT
jgi:hypothetical protein